MDASPTHARLTGWPPSRAGQIFVASYGAASGRVRGNKLRAGEVHQTLDERTDEANGIKAVGEQRGTTDVLFGSCFVEYAALWNL